MEARVGHEPMMRITQKLSSTWARSSAHSPGLIPRPTDILRRASVSAIDAKLNTRVRLHDSQPESLHLLDPSLVLLPKCGQVRPLVLSPQWLRLIWPLYRPIEVYSLMVVRLSVGDIFLQSRIACRSLFASSSSGMQ